MSAKTEKKIVTIHHAERTWFGWDVQSCRAEDHGGYYVLTEHLRDMKPGGSFPARHVSLTLEGAIPATIACEELKARYA